jgi:hypothetical protein
MRIFAGGREIDVPTDSRGNVNVEDVRRVVNVPVSRALILQRPSGENSILPKHGLVEIGPYDRFIQAPLAKRGKVL